MLPTQTEGRAETSPSDPRQFMPRPNNLRPGLCLLSHPHGRGRAMWLLILPGQGQASPFRLPMIWLCLLLQTLQDKGRCPSKPQTCIV